MANNDYAGSIALHYEIFWKVNPRLLRWEFWPPHELPSDFGVLEFPSGKKDTWIYATRCMSQPEDEKPLEIHMYSPFQCYEHVELLTAIANYHQAGEEPGASSFCVFEGSGSNGASHIVMRPEGCVIHVAGFNLGLLMRHLTGIGKPRVLQGALAHLFCLIFALLGFTSALKRIFRGWCRSLLRSLGQFLTRAQSSPQLSSPP